VLSIDLLYELIIMRERILSNLNDPIELEKLYRQNRTSFKRSFNALYPEIHQSSASGFWNQRLNFSGEEVSWGSRSDLIFIVISALIAGVIAKIPGLFQISEKFFYPRNIGFIVFPFLTAYFAWKNNLSGRKISIATALSLSGLLFINLIPDRGETDTMILSCIHLVLFLWCITGFAFVEGAANDTGKRLAFLKYNGDLIVMTTLILIAGGIMTGMTIGLFRLIGFQIEEFYFQHVVVFGLPAAPIIGTYLTENNPQLVGRVSPLIARIFSPLVLVMLVVYLVVIIYSGKNPYNDRDFLIIFNLLLAGVMAIVFFPVAEQSGETKTRLEIWVLLLLCALTILVNGIALSAIVFRISEFGITPNRAAVLGGNLLILVNLLLVTFRFFQVIFKKGALSSVGQAIAVYLPVYFAWTIVVTFFFPFIFGFKK
jgi:hypothetical protein